MKIRRLKGRIDRKTTQLSLLKKGAVLSIRTRRASQKAQNIKAESTSKDIIRLFERDKFKTDLIKDTYISFSCLI
jgi:hypothetical protein